MRTYNYLCHYGIVGQKWGVRRYQNPDGTLTEAGKARYHYGDVTVERTGYKGKEDYYKISQKGRKGDNSYYLEGNTYRAIETGSEHKMKEFLAVNTGRSVKDIESLIDAGAVDIKTINGFVDSYTRNDLVDVMDYMDKMHADSQKNQTAKSSGNASSTSKSKDADIPYADNGIDPSTEKYGRTKMSKSKAFETAYADLEKIHKNFNDLPLDKQDELFIDYVNKTGLYRWM